MMQAAHNDDAELELRHIVLGWTIGLRPGQYGPRWVQSQAGEAPRGASTSRSHWAMVPNSGTMIHAEVLCLGYIASRDG